APVEAVRFPAPIRTTRGHGRPPRRRRATGPDLLPGRPGNRLSWSGHCQVTRAVSYAHRRKRRSTSNTKQDATSRYGDERRSVDLELTLVRRRDRVFDPLTR